MLKISDHLGLPVDAATQTFAFIGRKGSGKTYAGGKLTELLLESGVQVVILDTVGNWYGLRLSADGKRQAFDVPVFGGLRGDLPLEATAGELVADVAVDTGRSLIVDLSQFSLHDRKRFATSFGERLWRRKKSESHPSPLMLVIEESQLIIPQRVGRDEARMVGIYEEIIRLGRNYGIGVTMISQRPQSVNKEVLNQAECLFVFQVNGAQERKALREWIVHQGMDISLLDELPSLPVGTAYVWSPQWLRVLRKIGVAKKVSFDASATPRVGQKQVRRELAPLDLKEIEQRMSAIVEKARADDPRELRRRIASLEKQLAERPTVKPEQVKVPALRDKDLATLEKSVERVASSIESLRSIADTLAGGMAKAQQKPAVPVTTIASRPAAISRPRPLPRPRPTAASNNGTADQALSGGERKILTALAQYPQGRTKVQVAVLTHYAHNGGGFNNYLGALRNKGFVVGDIDRLAITQDGIDALGDFDPLPTGQELLEHWLPKLSKAERLILETAAANYPNAMSKEEVAEATGYEASGGGFNNALGKLRTLELISGRGEIRASDALFE